MNVQVVFDLLDMQLLKLAGGSHLRHASSMNGGECGFPADQFRRDERVDFIYVAAVEEAAKQVRASFDEHVRHPANAQLIQERPPHCVSVPTLAPQDFTPGGLQLLDLPRWGVRAGDYHDGCLRGGLDQLAFQ